MLTEEDLWFAACTYFKWCDENPVTNKITIKSGKEVGTKVEEEYKRPYTIKGFCLHAGITEEYLRDIRSTKDKDSLYYHVVSRIVYTIFVQNTEYAILGLFNPIFTAKILNIETDDTPTGSVRVEIVTGLPPLSRTENEVLEKLESEMVNITKEQL